MDNYVDDCICPVGVVHRTRGKVHGLTAIVVGSLIMAGGIAICEAVKAVRAWINSLTRVNYSGVGETALTVLTGIAFSFFIVVLLFGYWMWCEYRRQQGRPVPHVAAFKSLKVWIWELAMRRDIGQSMRRNPELSMVGIEEVLEDMSKHHDVRRHEGQILDAGTGKVSIPAELISAYKKAYVNAQN